MKLSSGRRHVSHLVAHLVQLYQLPTEMRSAYIAVVADVSSVTSPLLHCTAIWPYDMGYADHESIKKPIDRVIEN